MSKKQSESVNTRASKQELALAAGELTGQAVTINYTLNKTTKKPDFTSLSSLYFQIRYWARESSFLKSFIPLKRSVYNYGLRLVAIDPKKQEAVDKWLDEDVAPIVDKFTDTQSNEEVTVESTSSNRERVEKWMEDAWTNFLLFDADIAMWMDKSPGAVSLTLERVIYTDTFGLELVSYTHGLSSQQLAQLSPDMQKIFDKPKVILNPKNGLYFKVLKRSALGDGLPVPSMYSVISLLDEIEGKEVGMNALGFACRSVKRVHRIGHEIKNGQHAGKNSHFIRAARARAVNNAWKDMQGFEDYSCNFDEEVEYPFPDAKLFDSKYFETSNQRLLQWAGPIAQMVVAKGVMPYLTNVLRASVTDDRRKFGTYAGSVISRGFGCPSPVRLEFSDSIFSESRLAAEMVKFGFQSGGLSSGTLTEQIGFNPVQEGARKLMEADDPDALKKLTPIWDAAHGSTPALGETAGLMASKSAAQAPSMSNVPQSTGKTPGNTPGRKPGTPNAQPSIT
jgi:hypothetical protein